MHYTRILMGAGGAAVVVAMFLDPFSPDSGATVSDLFGDGGLETWKQIVLWASAGAMIGAMFYGTRSGVLDRNNRVIVLIAAIAGLVVASTVFSDVSDVAEFFGADVGPGTYLLAAGPLAGTIGAALQWRATPSPKEEPAPPPAG